MGYDAILARSPSIIYQPGGTASDLVVTSWAQVQKFIAARQGSCVVFVDDSFTSPATVPAATGVTDGMAKLELRPFREDIHNYVTLVVEDGATLKGINKIVGTLVVLGDTMSATPAFSWDYTVTVVGVPWPILYLEDNAYIGTTTTATEPAIFVASANPLNIVISGQGGVIQGTVGIPVVDLGAGGTLVQFFLYSAKLEGGSFSAPTFPIDPSWVSGSGTAVIEYDSSTVALSAGIQNTHATTNTLVQLDTNLVEMTFTVGIGNVLVTLQDGPIAMLPKFGLLPCELEGFGGSGGGGGGQAGGAANGVGGGGSGGVPLQRGFFTFDLSHRLDILIGAGGTAGTAGAAPAGNGGNGSDGTSTEALDFTTKIALTLLGGSSGGQGGGPGPGRGGATYPGGVFVPNISDVNGPPYGSGFVQAGGIGGSMNNPGAFGQGALTSLLRPALPLPTTPWGGGPGGSSGAGEGGGGGGGGAGITGPGSGGGSGQPAGTPGGNGGGTAPNSGSGAGGGAGGAGVTDNGGAGGTGSTGLAKLRFLMP